MTCAGGSSWPVTRCTSSRRPWSPSAAGSCARAIWRQHFTYGLDDPKLYRRFRAHGMPRKLGRAARRYAWLVAHLHHLRNPSTRPSWIRVAAGQAGRLVGTVRERALYL